MICSLTWLQNIVRIILEFEVKTCIIIKSLATLVKSYTKNGEIKTDKLSNLKCTVGEGMGFNNLLVNVLNVLYMYIG